jgi:hypothetical protein
MPVSADLAAFFDKTNSNQRATLYRHFVAGTPPPTILYFLSFDLLAPPDLSFQQSWEKFLGVPNQQQNGGVYIFTRQVGDAGFVDRLVAYIQAFNNQYGLAYRYVCWIDDSNAPVLSGPAIPFVTSGQGGSVFGTVARAAEMPLRNLVLRVSADVSISPYVAMPNLEFKQGGAATIRLENRATLSIIGSIGQTANLLLTDSGAGRFEYGIAMTAASGAQPDDLKRLGAGLKYFYSRSGRIVSQLYPVFGGTKDGQPIPCTASFDPLHALDHQRTFFTFSAGQPSIMESWLRTEFMHPVALTPVKNQSHLVLQPDCGSLNAPPAPQAALYYVVPSGRFLLHSETAGSLPQLMCGLSGLETVRFRAATPYDVLTFHPDEPAYAPVFPIPAAAEDSTEGGPIDCVQPNQFLDARYVTSWMTISAGSSSPPVYQAQPDGAPLYALNNGAGKSNTDYLGHFDPITALLNSPERRDAFPLATYFNTKAGASGYDVFSAADIRQFEIDVIAPQRRAAIPRLSSSASGIPPAGAGAGRTRATTPQGFLAEVNDNGTWARLLLGRVEYRQSPTAPTELYQLQFFDLNPTLQSAFQSNQLFLVVTQPDPCWRLKSAPEGYSCTQPTTFDNFLKLEGWPFQINTGFGNTLGSYQNVLIFKFCDGSLAERIKNPRKWTNPCAFNSTEPGSLDAVSQWLQDYIAEAETRHSQEADREYFARFLEIVRSPSWQGVLALNVDMNLTEFPRELQGLLAGIDLSNFQAHHLGMELSFVRNAKDFGGAAELEADGGSSVFGLIYYVDPSYQAQIECEGSPDLPVTAPSGVDYSFKVLTLKVLFANSAIKAFSSKTQITLNQVFGDTTLQVTSGSAPAISNSIVLNGVYENHDGQGVYVFNTNASSKFWLDSNLWHYVEFSKAAFSTLNNQTTGTKQVQARFTFWGFLNFQEQVGLDAISFGSEEGRAEFDSRVGLSFSNLNLDLVFNVETPSQVTYYFVTDAMTFVPGGSVARRNSLYQHFPIAVTRMLRGALEKYPDQQGYLKASASQLRTEPLTASWYGLEFDLNMGTSGALAAAIGFTSQLLIAWSPGGRGPGYRMFIGLKLPGAGGGEAKLFTLQGVLKVTVQQLQLFRTMTVQGATAYLLRMTNILVSVLGVGFPPGTSTLFFLFGDPRPGAARESLGWYAAVNREPKSSAILLPAAGRPSE